MQNTFAKLSTGYIAATYSVLAIPTRYHNVDACSANYNHYRSSTYTLMICIYGQWRCSQAELWMQTHACGFLHETV